MGKDFEGSDSGNWNVAQGFTEFKIMIPLKECDYYEQIAQFGTNDLIEEIMQFDNNPNLKNTARIKGIKRFLSSLLRLVGNTQFAVQKKDINKMKEYKERLEKIKSVLPQVESRTIDQRHNQTTVTINEEKFQRLLDILINIKNEINEPLNRADLIFTHKEEFDPHKYKENIKNRFVGGE